MKQAEVKTGSLETQKSRLEEFVKYKVISICKYEHQRVQKHL